MKLLLLADPESIHTVRWANALIEREMDITIFGLNGYKPEWYDPRITIQVPRSYEHIKILSDGNLSKLLYLKSLGALKRVIESVKPDIVHAHYASSYGLIGALTSFHPYVVSVYGSDIYNFPKKNILTDKIIKFNLRKADKLLSTSTVMAKTTQSYTTKDITVTPFGVDTEKFKPFLSKSLFFNEDDIVIGTVKTLEDKYGIDYLIKAFQLVKKNLPSLSLKLLIVGKGSKAESLHDLVRELNLTNDVKFTGFIDYSQIPQYQNAIDIAVFPSTEDSESFGVSVLEASACEKPVVVSKVGGLPEVVIGEKTGLIVEKKNEVQLAGAIEKLLLRPDLRREMGRCGRERVLQKFSEKICVDKMIDIYNSVLHKKNGENH